MSFLNQLSRYLYALVFLLSQSRPVLKPMIDPMFFFIAVDDMNDWGGLMSSGI